MKKATKFLTYLIISCFIFSISSDVLAQSKRQIRKAKKLAIEEMIKNKVDSLVNTKDLVLFINEINPSDGEIIRYSEGYIFTLKNDKITCNLPYYGRSKVNVSTYSSDNIRIEFVEKIVDVYKSKYKGETTINIKAVNEIGEEWIFYLNIFGNAEFRMSAESIKREKIYFSGKINNLNFKDIEKEIDKKFKKDDKK